MEKAASIIIPNYNGRKLLEKNLPKVVKEFDGCEIIIVDDASNDGSQAFIKEKYPKIKLIEIKKNRKFAHAVNTGAKFASGKYLLFLNSDVEPTGKILEKSIKQFNDANLFAIGFADLSHESGQIIERGRGGAKFERGFIKHFKLPSQKGETLWVSGGSCIIDRDKFNKLGGFDENFYPFYWEDIDLSFRAWQEGYKCIFDPDLKVHHYHEEGSIKNTHSQFFIRSASYKNQFIFVWKNITNEVWIIEHLLWLPYHLTKALANFDLAFYFGFFWALTQIPQLILNTSDQIKKIPDEEVIRRFEK